MRRFLCGGMLLLAGGTAFGATEHEPTDTAVSVRSAASVPSYELAVFENNLIPVDSTLFMEHVAQLEFQIPLDYNAEVKRLINYFGVKWQDKLKDVLTLSSFYFPVYESALDKYNLPLELKYISVIESALNPHATSSAGAVGLWQFMPYTGKIYDLSIDRYVDERKHIEKSTEAACQYFSDMSKSFDDWLVVIASYNCGPGNVRKAMRASGGKTGFWEIYPYLPSQTRTYIPSFIAVAYLMNFAQYYGITPSPVDVPEHGFKYVEASKDCSLDAIAEAIGTPKSQLLAWNPALRAGQIPVNKSAFPLYMPEDKCYAFLECQPEIQSKSESLIPAVQERTHTVRRGESLQLIARKHGCSVTEIKRWNHLKSNVIHPGQRLHLYL
ncbi:MAG: transglycosylase SLT domain-containing protein [Flavobacteriales bacterium]|nr:transglycosylase SLT domain-containing protein [Flavobacteriales bacterium]